MNYIGSKFKLSTFLYDIIATTIQKNAKKSLNNCMFCDLFAGTCAVGRLFKSKVRQVVANDKEFYSFVLARNYIQNHQILQRADELISLLNDIKQTPNIQGKIFKHYALGGGEDRQYFSDYNAQRIDGIRIKIEDFKKHNIINENEYFFLLASLLESSDKVANTASVYGAFLKHLKKSAQKEFILTPAYFEPSNNIHIAYNKDANTLIKNLKGDILYLDPPYNAREYGANYHILNTIALYDDFIPKGKTGLREYKKSHWCKKAKVQDELEYIIKNAQFDFIFLSYNDEGLLSLNQIKSIFERYGKYCVESQKHQRFKADSNRAQKQESTIEYLHILQKF